ncbi:hypothetical protein P4679_22220 [Priestia megaterium]|uniref:hypothetical protein n=1 Tax=Priestia megaterium TaxID=1404 RepID=UPI002E21B2EA|nr:hypothetical protein [Priestia megaterium]
MPFLNWATKDIYLLIYSLVLIGNYISSLREYKKNKTILQEMDEAELQFELDSIPKWKLFILRIVGAIIFKWLFFIVAVSLTANATLLILSLILIVLRLYVMYHTLSELKKTKFDLYVLIGETSYTLIFSLYYFGVVLK